ncbi:unnamed protein product [Rotaria magnacalcarata]|uniref:Uncharacterized protein n=1 Tax=Rotaria magnacalcarata TaxID=392030 RepID=A0A820SE92_9BILA|nr:unnamed protein product [Rotaria magnacalcarata]
MPSDETLKQGRNLDHGMLEENRYNIKLPPDETPSPGQKQPLSCRYNIKLPPDETPSPGQKQPLSWYGVLILFTIQNKAFS